MQLQWHFEQRGQAPTDTERSKCELEARTARVGDGTAAYTELEDEWKNWIEHGQGMRGAKAGRQKLGQLLF